MVGVAAAAAMAADGKWARAGGWATVCWFAGLFGWLRGWWLLIVCFFVCFFVCCVFLSVCLTLSLAHALPPHPPSLFTVV